MQQPTTTQRQPPTPPCKQYIVRYTSDYLLINDEPVNYGPQILDLDKLYIIVTGPQSKLSTPIVLDRTREVDELDRKIFFRTFLLEIVKGMEISGFEDAAFILQRVPKLIKYFVGIVQKVSLVRWIQLLGNDAFFLVLYQTLEQLISNRQISKLRTDFIEEIIQVHVKAPYARMFFLLQNLLLENENLRNAMVNLARQIVMKEVEEKRFFEVHLLGINKNVLQQQGENEVMEDNRSETDSRPEDMEMPYPEKFLSNSINVLKSCQKIKITKETIIKKILNSRFFKILKYFFQGFFEKQKLQLLEILALASQIQPIQLWKITFDQGRTTRCKTLFFLESLLTNSMISSSDLLKKPRTTKKLVNQSLAKDSKQQEPQYKIDKDKSWQLASIIIEKFISINSPERKVLFHKILNTLLMCRTIDEELDFVMMFLESSAKDQVYAKKNTEVWKVIVKKIEAWVKEVMKGKGKKEARMNGNENKESGKKINNNSTMQPNLKTSFIICQQPTTILNPSNSSHRSIYLPIPKLSLIKLLKIYKIIITHQQKFEINLDLDCLMYLVDLTEKSKGVIEGVRMALIEVMGKRESLIAENLESDGEEFAKEQMEEGKWGWRLGQ